MKECKDCICYEACGYHVTEETDMSVKECATGFKDSEEYVKVVRCKECKYARGNLIALGMVNCLMYRDMRKGEDFCNYGEKCENCGTPKIHGI